MELNTAVQWQQVTCRGCKRTYRCTLEDDYYGATTLDDGLCFSCLLAENGFSPETTPVLAIDETGAELDPRDLSDPEAFQRWQATS